MNINPITATDFYKTGHIKQYPKRTTEIYSNFTARSARLGKVIPETFDNKIIFFGLQYFIKDFLIDTWNVNFFFQDIDKILHYYKRRMDLSLGVDAVSITHIKELHDLGYLPIKIKALPEGAKVPIGVPVLTIVNTHPNFYWLTNYLETALSSYLWKPITTATIANEYKKLVNSFAIKTGTDINFTEIQCHDFSFRGLSNIQDAAITGLGHLTSFIGTDTIPAIDLAEEYYEADASKELIGCSVPATEHSVMSTGSKETELETYKRLITDVYPKGIVSIVSDTWNFWNVINSYSNILKKDILARNGKVVFRPDSGDPVKIICGDPQAIKKTPEFLGAVECLWNIFGGTITKTGHKLLDSHVGLIYGDSITLERAQEILSRLDALGFASGNIVFGIGSYTYQYVTRDTFGFAMKSTNSVVDGKSIELFKDPITDSGTKKSAKGLLRVELIDNEYKLLENQTVEEEQLGQLKPIFIDGKLLKTYSLNEIRTNIKGVD